jgi:imidazolonepropionase-like amidohydrolase
MDAIVSATSTAARALGLGDRVGTVAPGLDADLIALDGDPLRDIALLRDRANLRLVLKDGTPHVNRLAVPAPVAV